jgi:DnaJ-class molecular chaperone
MTQENPIPISRGDSGDSGAFEPGTYNEVMVICPMCNGQGQIILEYLEKYADEEGERWLPCSDCDGTGKLPEGEIPDRQSNDSSLKSQRTLYELYRVVVEAILRG